MGNKILALMLTISTSSMLGCVLEGTEDAEGGSRQESGLAYPDKVGSQGVLSLAGVGDEGDASDGEDLKALEDVGSATSSADADLGGEQSDGGRPSDLPSDSLLSGCSASQVNWVQFQAVWNGNIRTGGSYICDGELPAANHGVISAAMLSNTDRVGSAQYTCSNGEWMPRSGASCNGKVISTTSASGIANTCSSVNPVQSKWISWYLVDLKRCADIAGLNFWVNDYINDADCLATDNYRGFGSKDACWRAKFRSAADANANSYSQAQALNHVSPEDEAGLCSGLAYPWTGVSVFGTTCKHVP